jgi:hypothetical protein
MQKYTGNTELQGTQTGQKQLKSLKTAPNSPKLHFCRPCSSLSPVYFCTIQLVEWIGISRPPILPTQNFLKKNIQRAEKWLFSSLGNFDGRSGYFDFKIFVQTPVYPFSRASHLSLGQKVHWASRNDEKYMWHYFCRYSVMRHCAYTTPDRQILD